MAQLNHSRHQWKNRRNSLENSVRRRFIIKRKRSIQFDPIGADIYKATDKVQDLPFITYDTAPNSIETKFHQQWNTWSKQIPKGAERFYCTLMAIFLLLFLVSVQIFVWTLNHNRIVVQFNFCNPPTYSECISTECHIKLLILAWLASIIISTIQMATYFLYWNGINIMDSTEKLKPKA